MAIDTAAKRSSASRLLVPGYTAIIPDGAIIGIDRMAAAWVYNGISTAIDRLFYFMSILDPKYAFTGSNPKYNFITLNNRYKLSDAG